MYHKILFHNNLSFTSKPPSCYAKCLQAGEKKKSIVLDTKLNLAWIPKDK